MNRFYLKHSLLLMFALLCCAELSLVWIMLKKQVISHLWTSHDAHCQTHNANGHSIFAHNRHLDRKTAIRNFDFIVIYRHSYQNEVKYNKTTFNKDKWIREKTKKNEIEHQSKTKRKENDSSFRNKLLIII